ncbi:four-carbon acid sugar kinase family protein [Franzmannia qiaohouensis]|uniref:Four-carbon acid sugar kinase family protein n=1 Tax=Franzmannia qiaohouensis TaxID=1329370 RepID=A0ABU1HIQ4_9GAMM|nr:four-carbon acid sugar kinase family protein [Halomonas qiaohouensis]MDR5907374.1 four-carbon acid sugar kinase family protein [Halomonas qiaohouensis]
MSRCRLAIIADDLTGALDACAPFAARGADARVVVAQQQLPELAAEWQGAPPEVVAINTESRHLSAEAAAERVTGAFEALRPLAPGLWFKKVDSTLRGQVIAECKALRQALGLPLLLAPAVPAQQREVRAAEVWVDGVRLADSDYRLDARSPPLAGPIDEAFAAAGLPLARVVAQPGITLAQCDAVVDSCSESELAVIYDAALRAGGGFCLAGAAGLAQAAAQRLFGRLLGGCPVIAASHAKLYVVGSRAPRSDAQCQQLLIHAPDLAALTPDQLCGAPVPPARLLLRPPPGGQDDAAQVARALAEGAAAWLAVHPTGLLFATGGDTALAVLTRLGVRYLSVAAEWSPGVVLGLCDGDPARPVITKAGGFGDPQLLAELHGSMPGPRGYAVSR